jgi:hypothetical protein
MIYTKGGSTMVEWGSVTHQMAVPVPSISCCVLNFHNLFYQIQNAIAFNRDMCCHLALCLWLLPFHYWHILIRQRGRIPLLALGEWKTVKSYYNKFFNTRSYQTYIFLPFLASSSSGCIRTLELGIISRLFYQGMLKGEVSLYHWPPFWLVWKSAVWQQTIFVFICKID